MDQKTIGWVSYLTLVGWIIALISYNGSNDKSALARFHLRQALGLYLSLVAIGIMSFVLIFILGPFAFLLYFLNLAIFVFWIIGLVAALNGEAKPVPVVGNFYQTALTFIN